MTKVKWLRRGATFERDRETQWVYAEWQTSGGYARIRHLKEDGDLLCFWNIKPKSIKK